MIFSRETQPYTHFSRTVAQKIRSVHIFHVSFISSGFLEAQGQIRSTVKAVILIFMVSIFGFFHLCL